MSHPSTKDGIKRIINSPPHGIGIEGASGSGKKYLAKYIAAELLGIADIDSHPYSRIINSADKIGIEEIREAITFLSLKIPGESRYKRCLMFWSFEKLSRPAQNALLKSLEEPPADTLIIITTDSKSNLLPTTASRLSWLSVLPVSEDEAISYFATDFDKSLIKKACALSGGKPGMLSQLLNDYDKHPFAQSIESVKEMLKLDRFERIAEVNKLTKDKEFDVNLYLLSLSKVLEAMMKKRLDNGRIDRKMLGDLKKVLTAEKFQKYNTNQKLLLTDIFYNL